MVITARVFHPEDSVIPVIYQPSTFSAEVVAPWPQASGGTVRYSSNGKEESALAAGEEFQNPRSAII